MAYVSIQKGCYLRDVSCKWMVAVGSHEFNVARSETPRIGFLDLFIRFFCPMMLPFEGFSTRAYGWCCTQDPPILLYRVPCVDLLFGWALCFSHSRCIRRNAWPGAAFLGDDSWLPSWNHGDCQSFFIYTLGRPGGTIPRVFLSPAFMA